MYFTAFSLVDSRRKVNGKREKMMIYCNRNKRYRKRHIDKLTLYENIGGNHMENNTILVVGQAKPSKEDAIYNLHGEFYISLIVERDTGKILELDCNTILDVTKRFVESMFVGKSLKTDVPAIEKEIKERYFALTQKPLIACMKDACNRYLTAIGETRGK